MRILSSFMNDFGRLGIDVFDGIVRHQQDEFRAAAQFEVEFVFGHAEILGQCNGIVNSLDKSGGITWL